MTHSMSRTLHVALLLLSLLAGFFALNLLAGRYLTGLRVDATEDRAFTLTKGSRSIARLPDEPVRLTFYFSSKAAQGQPQIETYARRVREVLQEYARASGGKVNLEIIDPAPYSEQEEDAARHGLTAVPVSSTETLYFGLVGTSTIDTREVIAYFDPSKERFLEYDLSRLIYSLANPTRKIVGLITSLPLEGGFAIDPRTRQPAQTPGWRIVDEMRTLFEVRALANPTEIPADIDVLMVVHPKDPSPATLYAIDQFVLRGGRLLMFIDPLCENDNGGAGGQMNPSAPRNSTLGPFEQAWGVAVAPDSLAADEALALRVYVGNANNPEAVPYLVWLGADGRALAEEDAVTGNLKQVILGTAGIIRPAADAPAGSLTITPMIRTTEQAAALPVDALGFPPDPKALLTRFTPGSEALTMAARLTGKARSAFADGPPPPPPPAEGQPPAALPTAAHLAESASEVNIILVADCDLLSDSMWVRVENFFGQPLARKVSDNADLVMSAIDNLTGNNDLIAIRARRESARPFKVVEAMYKEAEKQNLAELDILQARAAETEQKLRELQSKRGDADSGLMLSPEQEAEIEKLRAERLETRRAVRQVRSRLNADIERLGSQLKFINIAVVPILVAIFAVGLGAARRSRRARAVKTQ